jgi:hypothetical protein
MIEFSFGYGRYHCECWFHKLWHIGGNDTIHEYWYQPTLGMDGVE